LANYFLDRFVIEFGGQFKKFSAEAFAAITTADWPGNIRELENRVRRAVVMSEGRVIEPADLELSASPEGLINLDIRAARMKAERQVIQLALSQSNGTISTAAKLLGISRPTLYALFQEHGIGTGVEIARDETIPKSARKPTGIGKTES
jgi:two-component system NtrC family response regulator